MNWYKIAQRSIKPCDKIKLIPNPQLPNYTGTEIKEYYYITEDDKNYYVKDSCGFGDNKSNSWAKTKNLYTIQKL